MPSENKIIMLVLLKTLRLKINIVIGLLVVGSSPILSMLKIELLEVDTYNRVETEREIPKLKLIFLIGQCSEAGLIKD